MPKIKTPLIAVTLLFVFATISDIIAKADITFNGDLQYRFRYHYVMLKDFAGEDSSAAPDLLNTYAWNLKWKIAVNKNLMFGIRLSNPAGYATDRIAENLEKTFGLKNDKDTTNYNYNILSIPELYFKWSVGLLSLSAGIIPVKPNSALNLAVYEFNGYKGAGITNWAVRMNNSQKGLDLGLQFLDNESVTFGMGLVAAIADDAPGSDKYNTLKYDQVRLLVTFPTTISNNMISLLPAMHVRLNAFRSIDTVNTESTWDDANHSIVGGCDLTIKPMENFTVKIGGAGGMYNNECQVNDSTLVGSDNDGTLDLLKPVTMCSPLGILANAKLTYEPGFGKAIVDFSFGRSRDREHSPALNNNLFFWDIKYNMPIKSLNVMPRMRIWYFKTEKSNATETRLRPELILKASF